MNRFVVATLGLVLTGCAGTDWSRNLYEGIRQQQEAVPSPTTTQPATHNPDYEQYRREREALKDEAVR